MSAPRPPKLLVAGGGTGGHVLIGVAVADAWRARYGAEAPVFFVGTRGGLEEKLVPRAGYPLELLRLGPLKGVGWLRRLRTLAQIPLSFIHSLRILLRERPGYVIGVGGYASGPFVLLARAFARTAIIEPNSVPGFTNRVLGRFVHEVFTAFPAMEGRFPGARVVNTGNPIRAQFARLPAAGRDPFTIFVFGGSQGALGINTLVIEALPLLADLHGHLRFVHQTGEKDYARVRAAHAQAGLDSRVEKFIDNMPQAYGEASLLICRAGATTLSEIASVGRAAVLVPLPTAADNHQERNARVLSDAGAARLLVQTGARGADLARVIRELRADAPGLARMEEGVTAFYRPQAAQDIVRELTGER